MKAQVNDIIRDVELALNEVDPNAAQFVGDRDNEDLRTLISSNIESCTDELHKKADMRNLALDSAIDIFYDGDPSATGFSYRQKSGILTVMLQSHSEGFDRYALGIDLLRMVSAKACCWPYSISNTVFPDDPLYEIVTDRFVGAQADFPAVTQRKKKMTVGTSTALFTTLELRSLSNSEDKAHIIVIPRAKIENGAVDIDRNLYPALIERLAEKTLSITNNR